MALEECCISERKRTEGQNPMQRSDCSQIENEEQEESWQEGDQMAEQWEEEQHLEDIVERRRVEGSSLKWDVIQKVLALLVDERMFHGQKVKNIQAKKKVPGWSIEEMKDMTNFAEEDAEDLNRWRSLNQSEMDYAGRSWRREWRREVLDKYKVEESKRGAFQGRSNHLEWRRVRKKQEE